MEGGVKALDKILPIPFLSHILLPPSFFYFIFLSLSLFFPLMSLPLPLLSSDTTWRDLFPMSGWQNQLGRSFWEDMEASSQSLPLRQNTTCRHISEPIYSTFQHSGPLAVTVHKLLHSDTLGLEYAAPVCTGRMYTANIFRNVSEFALEILSQFYSFSVQPWAVVVQSKPHLHNVYV